MNPNNGEVIMGHWHCCYYCGCKHGEDSICPMTTTDTSIIPNVNRICNDCYDNGKGKK